MKIHKEYITKEWIAFMIVGGIVFFGAVLYKLGFVEKNSLTYVILSLLGGILTWWWYLSD